MGYREDQGRDAQHSFWGARYPNHDTYDLEALEPRLLFSTTLFEDSFDSGTLAPTTWAEVLGATIDDAGVAEPSGEFSLRLNGDAIGGDRITSRIIDLSGLPAATLSYAYQRTGSGNSPEAGEDLILEAWNGEHWIELQRHAGDGEDMQHYQAASVSLSGDLMRDDFRLRLRSIGSNGAYDDWFVDNVAVTALDIPSFQIVEHSPEGTTRHADSFTVQFNAPVAPSSFTADDIRLVAGQPALISSLPMSGEGYGIDVEICGDYAYVTNGQSLYVLDISDPAAPSVVSEIDTGMYIRDLCLNDHGYYAYLNSGYGGIQVWDLTSPNDPRLIDTVTTNGSARCVTALGCTGFFVGTAHGVEIFQVDSYWPDVSTVEFVGSIQTPDSVDGIAFGGYQIESHYYRLAAYLVCGSSGLVAVDVSDPTFTSTPLLSSIDLGYALDFTICGSLAYLSDISGLHVLDVSDPTSMSVISSSSVTSILDVEMSGSFAFIATGLDGLLTFDMSDPATPVLVGTGLPYMTADHLAHSDNFLMAANWNGVRFYQSSFTPSAVVALDDSTFRIEFSGGLPQGDYRVHVGPNIQNVLGTSMDQDGDTIAGESSEDQFAFSFSHRTSTIAGRHIFYNESVSDGYDAAPGVADDNAIDPNKIALLPGEEPTGTNWTAYNPGITGLMIDIAGLTGVPMVEDFDFNVCASPETGTWTTAPSPSSFTIRQGEGTDESDRLTITWPGGAIRNTWLKVTVKANDRTGLAEDDVFYFGNLVGDADGNAVVDLHDFALLKQTYNTASSPGVGANFDGNDQVDLHDFTVLKSAFGQSLALFTPDVASSIDVIAAARPIATPPFAAMHDIQADSHDEAPLVDLTMAAKRRSRNLQWTSTPLGRPGVLSPLGHARRPWDLKLFRIL